MTASGSDGIVPELVVLDVDGTLLDERGRLPAHRRPALVALRDVAPMMLATGKTWPSVAGLARDLSLEGPHLTCNGAAAVHLDGHVEVLAGLERRVADALVAALLDADVAVSVYLADGTAVTPVRHEHHAEIGRVAEDPPEVRAIPPDAVVLKVLAVVPEEQEGDLRRLHADACRIQRTGPWFLEWNAPTASKGHGLRELASRRGIHLAATVGVGDSENDVSMFEAAGLGVAVQTASPVAVAAADLHLDVDVADWLTSLAARSDGS